MNPTVATGFNPGAGPVPGQNQNSATLPFRNFQISDVGSNFDYSFRAGIFAGDYSGNTIGPDSSRTADEQRRQPGGRRSGRTPATAAGRAPRPRPAGPQPDLRAVGRVLRLLHANGLNGGKASKDDSLFWVTPCPEATKDKGAGKH